jgi:hypothetical protein
MTLYRGEANRLDVVLLNQATSMTRRRVATVVGGDNINDPRGSRSRWWGVMDGAARTDIDEVSDRSLALSLGILHFPMIVGIVLFAFAMKTIVAHVGEQIDSV